LRASGRERNKNPGLRVMNGDQSRERYFGRKNERFDLSLISLGRID
jgi:hypothetical protein